MHHGSKDLRIGDPLEASKSLIWTLTIKLTLRNQCEGARILLGNPAALYCSHTFQESTKQALRSDLFVETDDLGILLDSPWVECSNGEIMQNYFHMKPSFTF